MFMFYPNSKNNRNHDNHDNDNDDDKKDDKQRQLKIFVSHMSEDFLTILMQ